MPFTLILNAGGQSRRMGQPKALLPVPPDGTPLLLYLLRRLQPLATQTLIIVNDPTLGQRAGIPANLPILSDRFPESGPLGGIASGLSVCSEWAMVVACDMPFVNPALFSWFQQIAQESDDQGEPRWDAIVPVVNGYAEPLHALYHPRCLAAIEQRLANGERRATCFYPDVRVRKIEQTELAQIDPELRSFININTPEDWQNVQRLIHK